MTLDYKKIRNDFPQLDGEGYHYLDAAASSLTPRQVLDSVIDYYTNYRANVHRGLFAEAVRATDVYEEVRKKVAKFVGADSPDEIIFTSGATESSNILMRMFEESFKWDEAEENMVTTTMEHHSALIPLQQLSQRIDLPLRLIPLKGFELDYDAAEKTISDKTVLVSVILASNVTGTINNVRRIADIAHRSLAPHRFSEGGHGAVVVVDATAAAGHMPIDVKQFDCDTLYFSGHKMLGPTGAGVLWIKKSFMEKLSPAAFGGHMIERVEGGKAEWAEMPNRFEAGTKNIAGVIGLGVAIDYINSLGVDAIHEHCAGLAQDTIVKLKQIDGVHVYSPGDMNKNIGTVSFTCDFAHPHDIAEVLARSRVAVRPGHHCAMPLHNALGIGSTTRASFHVYNSPADVDALIEGVKKAKEIFK